MELKIDRLTKQYKNKIAVDRLSAQFHKGVYGLLGANGAGKTTLMRMVCGIIEPTSGSICFNEHDVSTEEYRAVLGYLPQDFGYYPEFSGKDFLMYMAALKGISKKVAKEKTEELLELVAMQDMAKKKMKTYSGGMKQRIGIAQAMLNEPQILVLDEPTAGLDPKERVRFRNIISILSKDRIVILSTHIVSDIESIANQVILIKNQQLYQVDTVPNICNSLKGSIYEVEILDSEYEAFEKGHQVLAARQEKGTMVVRYYENTKSHFQNAHLCNANLEDVFLVTYQ